MSRIFLLTIYILLDFCSDGLAQNGDITSEEVDGQDGDERGTIMENDEKMNLLGLDYYGVGNDGSGKAFGNRESIDNFENYDYDHAFLSGHREEEGNAGKIVVLDTMDTRNFKAEIKAANRGDMLGTNPHYHQPDLYPDFGRRFVLQYPYREVATINKDVAKQNALTPKLASPELVLAVAEKSALLDAAQSKNDKDDVERKVNLRSGNYWNSVWKEDVDPKVLRTKQTKKLESVRAEIPPSSKLYDILTNMKHLSPTLLYVINERDT